MSARTMRKVCARPANDNTVDRESDALLHAALRHFAEHGLAAASRARKQAETAFFSGDRRGYHWWLEICRALDRRMASEMDDYVPGIEVDVTGAETGNLPETPTCKA
jgi:hypothetical protein